ATAKPRRDAPLCSGRQLENVNRRINDDPHDVDEVPVNARHLDAEMVLRLGAEMAAKGADRGEAEQHQADEDEGAVQAGEAVEDRAEGEIAGVEADGEVLVDLDEEEGGPQQPGQDQAELEPFPVAAADRLKRVVDRKARGDQDRRVDSRHGNREL